MTIERNYLDQTFVVIDADSRIRKPANLMSFEVYLPGDDIPTGAAAGDFKRIPPNTRVVVSDISIEKASSKSKRVFALVHSEDKMHTFGWTSTRNFEDKFKNVTMGVIQPEKGAGRFSETAAWTKGGYIGQISLILVMDGELHIERLTSHTAEPYLSMHSAAKQDGIDLYLSSGFRTYIEQKYLYDGWVAKKTGFNEAAPPGSSNHQNGIALDIPLAGGPGNPEYDWMAEHATSFGFIRTVRSEVWHWEFRPQDADKAKNKGTHTIWD